MVRSSLFACAMTTIVCASTIASAQMGAHSYGPAVASAPAPMPMVSSPVVPTGTRAYGRSWGSLSPQDWERFYHYPYVYYPHNFWGNGYSRSSDSLYYRYPSEMRIPVYNKKWHNYYPRSRPYHWGHHFNLDVL